MIFGFKCYFNLVCYKVSSTLYILYKKFLFVYLFLAAQGLCCCTWTFSGCVQQRGGGANTFVVVCRFLIAVASLTVEHGLQAHGLQELWCGLQSTGSGVVVRGLGCSAAWLLCGMWDFPRSVIEPVSPALAGGFLSTAPPGES